MTTPLGLAAYTGVPLTHREHTSAVTFVTGHNVEAIDWSKVGASETMVLFMGLVNFAAIARGDDRAWKIAGDACHGRALGDPAGSGDDGGDACEAAGLIAESGSAAAGDHRDRRSGGAARALQLVREAASVRTSASS